MVMPDLFKEVNAVEKQGVIRYGAYPLSRDDDTVDLTVAECENSGLLKRSKGSTSDEASAESDAFFEISTTTGCGYKKLSPSVVQRSAEADTPLSKKTETPGRHHQQPILHARTNRSNAEERNSVALVATNGKSRPIYEKGLKSKTQKHKIRFGGLCF
jgi:hypothetical protein